MVNILSDDIHEFFPFTGKDSPIKGPSILIDTNEYPQLRDDILDGRHEISKLINSVTEQTQRYWMNYILEIMKDEDILPDDQYERIKEIAERLTIPLA